MIKIISSVPLKFRIVVEVAIIIVIIAVYYFMSYKPQVEEINKLKKRYDSLALSVSRLKPVMLSYKKFKKEFEIVNEQFNRVLKILPNERNYNVLYDQIVGLAERNGIKVSLFQPTGIRKIDDFHSSVNFNMNMEGRFLDLVNFVYRINFLDKIININSLSINPIKDKEGNLILKANLGMNSYMFNVPVSGAAK
ncbi:type 4a pilus biogenesis protein PilO [Deferribacter autotrophicus]|uniref:type 4a pilus biogenesis protein PilO n=1 Tax=Deferribacter autotrophicus TaxID=500465 RepID=UPI001FEF1870|nr:type 4a pilus biogenesis protein PilO [Deferribacter autotrophicus]